MKQKDINVFKLLEDNLVITDRWEQITGILGKQTFLFLPSTNSNVDLEMLKYLKDKGVKIIYDYIDEIHQYISEGTEFQLRRHENLKSLDIDLVCAVSKKLYEEMVNVFSEEKVIYLPNGCDYSHFHINKDKTRVPDGMKEILQNGKPVIGYYGALAKWIDYDLINYVAQRRKDWNIVLIGVDYDGSLRQLNKRLDNIFVMGPVDYKILPFYAVWFDVAIIPFKDGNIAKATSPIKLFEFMALNKPVVYTKDLEECDFYESPLKAFDKDDFIVKVDKALNLKDDPDYISLVDGEAKNNTWEKRVETLILELGLKYQ